MGKQIENKFNNNKMEWCLHWLGWYAFETVLPYATPTRSPVGLIIKFYRSNHEFSAILSCRAPIECCKNKTIESR